MGTTDHESPFLPQAEGELWRRRYGQFVRLYRGRSDVIAERKEDGYVPVHGAGLTFERFFRHLHLEKTYAVYNRDDAGMVYFGLFDVDVLPRDKIWEKLLTSLEVKKKETWRIMQTLTEMGLERCNMLIEFPTVGFHLFIFFDGPVQAKALKTVMRFVLDRSGLEQVPFYPRETEEPLGDRIQLPLRVNQNTLRRSNFVRSLESFDPQNYPDEPDFSVLEAIVPIRSSWVSEMLDAHGLPR